MQATQENTAESQEARAMNASDLVTRRLAQIKGICSLVGSLGESGDVPDEAVSNAMWGVHEMIAEAERAMGVLHDEWRALARKQGQIAA